MANVFLSYDRDDMVRTRPIAQALEKAGHNVWWDRQIPGGAQYSKEIDKALKSADTVVVLWSERAVESAWVRDEAAVGRDRGRLVPVVLDSAEPPLGFRQFQAIDFSNWKGRGKPRQLRELIEAVEAHQGTPPSPEGDAPHTKRTAAPTKRLLPLSVLALLIVGSVAFFGWFLVGPRTHTPTVLVAASDDTAASTALARDLLIKLGQLETVDAESMQLLRQESGEEPDFTFLVSGSVGGRESTAAITLVGRDDVLLWSKDFEREGSQFEALHEQLGFTAARVLGCAREASSAENRLNQQTLSLYLNGCANYAELSGTSVGDVRKVIPIFRQVTARSPKFKGGWEKLLLAEAEVATNTLLSDSKSTEQVLREHLAAARELDPNMPEVLQTDILLLPVSAVAQRMRLIDEAIKIHPDDAGLRSLRSNLLMAVGRMNAAVQDAKHAAEIDVVSPSAKAAYVFALAHSGQKDLAEHELRAAEKAWPAAPTLNAVRFSIALRYGDPEDALKQLKRGSFRSEIPASQDSFLRARMYPSPENVSQAISDARAAERRTIRQIILVLAEFGQSDDALQILLAHDPSSSEQFTDILFRPTTRKMRNDPRFMLVAARFGLLEYWHQSGQWPDFCFEPGVPYDCRKEAAKIKRRRVKSIVES